MKKIASFLSIVLAFSFMANSSSAMQQKFNPEEFNSYVNASLKEENINSYPEKISTEIQNKFNEVHEKIVNKEIEIKIKESEFLENDIYNFLNTMHKTKSKYMCNKLIDECFIKINSYNNFSKKNYNKLITEFDERGLFVYSDDEKLSNQERSALDKNWLSTYIEGIRRPIGLVTSTERLVQEIVNSDWIEIYKKLDSKQINIKPKDNNSGTSCDILKDILKISIVIDLNVFFKNELKTSWRDQFRSLALVIDTATFQYFINELNNQDIKDMINQKEGLINQTKTSILQVIKDMEISDDAKGKINGLINSTGISIVGLGDPFENFQNFQNKFCWHKSKFQACDNDENLLKNIFAARKLNKKLEESTTNA